MKNQKTNFEPIAGTHIDDASKEAAALALKKKKRIQFEFNGIVVTVTPGDTWKKVAKQWSDKNAAANEAYRKSPAGIAAAHQKAKADAEQTAREKKHPFVPENKMRDQKVPWPKTIEELADYIGRLTDRPQDYGTCVYATSMAATATFQYVAGLLGITGFQASCAGLDILKRTRGLEGPFILLKAEDSLYPQYDLLVKLGEATVKWQPWLKEQAKAKLAKHKNDDHVHPAVRAHWERLAKASIPRKKAA